MQNEPTCSLHTVSSLFSFYQFLTIIAVIHIYLFNTMYYRTHYILAFSANFSFELPLPHTHDASIISISVPHNIIKLLWRKSTNDIHLWQLLKIDRNEIF